MQGVLAEWTKQCEQEYGGTTHSRIPKSTSLSICCSKKGQLCEIKQASEINRLYSRAAGLLFRVFGGQKQENDSAGIYDDRDAEESGEQMRYKPIVRRLPISAMSK